ncbi:unnamed protein product [Rotaria magnacalcarata]|uniref:Uncharacterized protein n=1 Tax=Rotaria magnacalcarata TaxID=392030 RepID=A0A816WFF7_9BILA|nr:unnamed protein product [Rotaria magnacalcarata]CAF3931294.1 unnamed protein product [Rotaria magnacalcarata]
MGSTKTNARGKQLQELLNEGIINCVDDDSITFEKNEYGAKLDWIQGRQPLLSFITNVETHPTIGTINGHKPLTFDIQIGAEPNQLLQDYHLILQQQNGQSSDPN